MNNLSRKQYFCGPALPVLNSGSWNSVLHPRNSIGEFIYADGGLHGRSSSASDASHKTSKKWLQAIPYRAGYRRDPNNPHFIKTDEIPSNSQKFTTPGGLIFLAPAGSNFQTIYNAGKVKGYEGMKSQVWQYGKFDFQRNSGGGIQSGNADNIFYSAYTNASNYAVGVYMNGAGASLWETLALARFAADMGSKNAGSPALSKWQTLGWKAAEANKSQWNNNAK